MPTTAELMTLLQTAGYTKAQVDEDGDVTFDHDDETFMFNVDAEDTDFVRLVLGFDVDEEVEPETALRVANELNTGYKTVKTGYDPEDHTVEFASEAFYQSPDHLAPYLSRLIEALGETSDVYFQYVRG